MKFKRTRFVFFRMTHAFISYPLQLHENSRMVNQAHLALCPEVSLLSPESAAIPCVFLGLRHLAAMSVTSLSLGFVQQDHALQ